MIRALVTFALVVLPSVAEACAVCGAAADRNRGAFLGTTIFLSLLPLGMIGGGIAWLRRRGGAFWKAEFEDPDERVVGEPAEPPPSGPRTDRP